ncbi:MAG: protein-S-isoprenylcysteine O-methyltransferase Ste14, partial [Dinoroseobacter sp.]
QVTFGAAIVSFLAVLGPYWLIGWVLISGRAEGLQSQPALSFAIGLYALGVALMIGADAQKFYTLRLRKGLIEDGMFARIRHPNYLGEMMIYGSFALVVWHWLPVVILGAIWGTLFASNIAAKEVSLSRHPGWASYKARTGFVLPKL